MVVIFAVLLRFLWWGFLPPLRPGPVKARLPSVEITVLGSTNGSWRINRLKCLSLFSLHIPAQTSIETSNFLYFSVNSKSPEPTRANLTSWYWVKTTLEKILLKLLKQIMQSNKETGVEKIHLLLKYDKAKAGQTICPIKNINSSLLNSASRSGNC